MGRAIGYIPAMLLRLSILLVLSGRIAVSAGQDVYDQIAKEACPCVEEAQEVASDSAQVKLGLCMIAKATMYRKELKKKHGVDLDRMDGDKYRELGQTIGARMVVHCPEFAEFAMRLAQASSVEAPPDVQDLEKRVQGVVQETHPSQFLTVVVKLEGGLTYELLLLDHVPNAERIYQEPASARGLKAMWSYEEREFLDPYTRAYKTYRVITGIEPLP